MCRTPGDNEVDHYNNNVWVKEGDKWKAVFMMHLGVYKPTAMFFGLTNLPATFQAMMNDILRDLT